MGALRSILSLPLLICVVAGAVALTASSASAQTTRRSTPSAQVNNPPSGQNATQRQAQPRTSGRVRLAPGATTAPGAAGPTSRQQGGQAERTIPLYVGESRLLDAPWPVKRVAINNPGVADVDVISPQQVQIQGIAPGVTDFTMWSEDERVWTASVEVELDLRRLQGQLAKVFPGSALEVSQLGEVVVVSGRLARVEQAGQLRQYLTASKLTFLDLSRVAGMQQVQLKVRVAEVSRNALRALGINAFYDQGRWFGGVQIGSSAGPLTAMNVGPAEGAGMGIGRVPFAVGEGGINVPPTATLFAGFPNSDLEFFIQALAENQYLRTMAEPTLVAVSGEDATFLVGGEVPIPVTDFGQGSTNISIEYREYGIRLKFHPTVLGEGTIRLQVEPEVSQLTDVGAIELQGTRIPALLTRRASSTLEMQDGQTFALAGLINRTTNARTSRVPGLGDLPILGSLFRSVRYETAETELVILVTVSLVEPQSIPLDEVQIPGVLHKHPNEWDLYAMGRIEGKTAGKLSPAQSARLKELGLDKLNGPGTWAGYGPADKENTATARPGQ